MTRQCDTGEGGLLDLASRIGVKKELVYVYSASFRCYCIGGVKSDLDTQIITLLTSQHRSTLFLPPTRVEATFRSPLRMSFPMINGPHSRRGFFEAPSNSLWRLQQMDGPGARLN